MTWLKVVGGSIWLALDRTRFAFSLGSGEPSQVDLSLPIQYVSRLHCKIERDGHWLVVTNHSRNGTFFGGQPEKRKPVNPGERFTVGATELLALDDHMHTLHAALHRALGFDAFARVDAALIAVAGRELPPPALVLTGAADSEPAQLAEAIHYGSSRRGQPFVTIDATAPRDSIRAAAASAGAGSIYVDLRKLHSKRTPAALADVLFHDVSRDADKETNKKASPKGPPMPVPRPMIAAPTLEIVQAMFEGRARKLEEIHIPPIAQRSNDIPALIDALLAEHKSVRRFHELALDRQEAVCAFDWPENQEDLRRTAPRLAAYLDAGRNVSEAARRLGVDSSTLAEALERVGIIERRKRNPARKGHGT